MARHGGLTITKAANALRKHHGILLKAAEACGVSRPTFYKFMNEHPELEDVRNEADEELLDIGEGHVVDAIKDGDMKTIRWQLERKGKNRGYTTRQEQTGADGGPLEFGQITRTVVDPKNED